MKRLFRKLLCKCGLHDYRFNSFLNDDDNDFRFNWMCTGCKNVVDKAKYSNSPSVRWLIIINAGGLFCAFFNLIYGFFHRDAWVSAGVTYSIVFSVWFLLNLIAKIQELKDEKTN